jgi:hypothetical protein
MWLQQNFLIILTILPTIMIAIFTYLQWLIARSKRKDDLFKLRYEFYKKIVNVFTQLQNTMSGQDAQQILANWLNDNLPHSENTIFEGECLFGVDIGDHLRESLSQGKIFIVLNNGKIKDGFWEPPLAFRAPFEPYLKINT